MEKLLLAEKHILESKIKVTVDLETFSEVQQF